ncbi:MAG: ATP-binding protein [Oligoflexia bacterium]|nr:ATP-binding protein [Oligoflexia bacterium]
MAKFLNNHIYLTRFLEKKLKKLAGNFPVIVVSGARQVGKSTLLEHVFPDLPRVVFDPLEDIEGAKSDPDLFLRNRNTPVILDEIQYVPGLVSSIKRFLEKNRSNGQFFITGSQQWEVMKNLSESLAGRAVFLDLSGLSYFEIQGSGFENLWLDEWLNNRQLNNKKNKKPRFTLFEQLWRGFLPEAQFIDIDVIPDFFMSYIRTYIDRDIRQIIELNDYALFNRFFKLCAASSANEINYSHFGREMGITPQTASRWLQVLTSTFQWIELPAFSGNTTKRVTSKPKGHLTDAGLICYCLGITSQNSIISNPNWGNIFESAVVMEIIKQSALSGVKPGLYHWRTAAGAEVDIIMELDNKFFPIEIKANSHPSKRDTGGIKAFMETYPHLDIPRGAIISPAENHYKLEENIDVIPFDCGC